MISKPTAGMLGLLALVAVPLAGCQRPASAGPAGVPSTSMSSAPGTGGTLPAGNPNQPIPAPGSCTVRHVNNQVLPDAACTPGALNPTVTQATIGTTICRRGWTATVRPPVSVTERIKKQIDRAYSLPVTTRGELDHLVSLELGGAPDDARNLWTEPGAIPNPKDSVENTLNRAVCSGRVTLTAAQHAIASDWTTAEHVLGLPDVGAGGSDDGDE
jgi:hypothetical protein